MIKKLSIILIITLFGCLLWSAEFKGICFGSYVGYASYVSVKYFEPVFVKADVSKDNLDNLGNNDKIPAINKMKEKAQMIAKERGYANFAIAFFSIQSIGYSADLLFW